MAEHPILFKPDMVQAIIEGRKTQTRRALKVQGSKFNGLVRSLDGKNTFGASFKNEKSPHLIDFVKCPYGQVGDLLWVRETFARTSDYYEFDTYSYKADGFHRDIAHDGMWSVDMCEDGWYDQEFAESRKWKPSIHLPKSACRLWLKITNIRVERLQHITEEDAIAEGIHFEIDDEHYHKVEKVFKNYSKVPEFPSTYNPKYSFETLWQSINGNWETNPWVWVIEFEQIQKGGESCI